MGLVERAGLGVPKMFQHQLETGKAPPEFSGTPATVRVSIPTGHIDEKMAAFVASRYRAGFKFDVADLLVLNRLRTAPEVRSQEVASLTQRTAHAASEHLQEMVSKDLLRRRGTGSGTAYRFAPALERELGIAARAAREQAIEQERHPEMIAQYVKRHGRITNRECQVLCDLTTFQASKLLRKLTDQGLLERRGDSRKLTFYVAAGSSDSP
jgi:ATP-dependent DNA helicase RecG